MTKLTNWEPIQNVFCTYCVCWDLSRHDLTIVFIGLGQLTRIKVVTPQGKIKEGWVTIYVKNHLQFKKYWFLSSAINILEIVTIDIKLSDKKNVIVSCKNKTPLAKHDDFNRELETLLNKFKFCKKEVFVCWDFSIDLLKYTTEHKGTQEFLDIMFNKGLHPIISKPSRITSFSSTLFGNILTKNIDDELYSGLW